MSLRVEQYGPVTVSLGWSAGTNLTSRIIQRLDTVPMPDGSRAKRSAVNHVFWSFDFENGPHLLYESHLSGGVQITPFDQLHRAYIACRVSHYYLHNLGLSQDTAIQLWRRCEAIHGAGYDKRHILGLYIWIRLFGRNHDKRPGWLKWALNDKYICSELTETTARQVGLDLCGDYSTPATSTPESQFCQVVGKPSETVILFGGCRRV